MHCEIAWCRSLMAHSSHDHVSRALSCSSDIEYKASDRIAVCAMIHVLCMLCGLCLSCMQRVTGSDNVTVSHFKHTPVQTSCYGSFLNI